MKYILFTIAAFMATVVARADYPGKDSLKDCKRVNDYSMECTLHKSVPTDTIQINKAFQETGITVPQENYQQDQFHGIIFPKGNEGHTGEQLNYKLKVKE
jgi:hypothetical protein